MFLNSGFTFVNLLGSYDIMEFLPKYNKEGREQMYIRVCHSAFNKGKLSEFLGTLNYAAPEILSGTPYDGFNVFD